MRASRAWIESSLDQRPDKGACVPERLPSGARSPATSLAPAIGIRRSAVLSGAACRFDRNCAPALPPAGQNARFTPVSQGVASVVGAREALVRGHR